MRSMKRPTREDAIKCTNLLSNMAQTILQLTESELNEQLTANGRDPKQVVADTKSLITEAIANSSKSKLRQARASLDAHRKNAGSTQRSAIPRDPAIQRNLLDRLLQNNVQLPHALTMAFRDKTNLSDSDLESLLRDLERLGFLSDLL